MKVLITYLCLVSCGIFFSSGANSQANWPNAVTASDGTVIRMYEWQPESYSANTLKARAAISVIENGKSDPTFGVAWLTASLQQSDQGMVVQSVRVNTLKLPGESLQDKVSVIQTSLENGIPSWNLKFNAEDLNSSLKLSEQQNSLSKSINNAPPEIIYSRQPSILVSIDGSPRLQQNSEWSVETVINSPFTIIKNRDGKYYLYGGKHWYVANQATGPFAYSQQVPENLTAIESAINDSYKSNDTEEEKNDYTISSIIVTTKPAELIQTDGEASFAAVQGTGLLYVRNSDDDIFMDVSSQNYYVLLSGRWYKSKTLSGQWQYVDADKLPADFAKIPKGSEKEDVLTSVAGTEAAQDALEEAQIPLTAKVDRNSASVDVVYDGEPSFENIDGTNLQYAVNSPYSVVRYRNQYYAVDNGVWFESRSARGPWVVAVTRPYEIALIPPRYPVYHIKYVYIYDVAPDYVYMGYTPGYLNTYIYGPTIVYGTGYHYRPWYGKYYYPRPSTWGYNMRYSPWVGWGFGVNINFGWFNIGIGDSYWGYSRCGWWGPSAYRPNHYYRGGYYGYNNYRYGGRYNNVYINNTYINYNNNVYNNRRGISTRNNQRYSDNRQRDWSNNYNNRNGNNNRERFDRINNNGRNNGNNNNNGGRINNNNRSNDIGQGNNNANNRRERQYNPGNINNRYDRVRDSRISNNNENNNGNNNIGRERQYNPGSGNVTPDRGRNRTNTIENNNNNRGQENNRQREVQRSDRQYRAPESRDNDRSGRSVERNGNNGGSVNNNGNRAPERREGSGRQNDNNSSNGRGNSGRRGG